MEPIGLRTPSPGQTNSGRTNCEGSRWVSRTRRRIDSETRSRRLRWSGKDIRSHDSRHRDIAATDWGSGATPAFRFFL